MKKKKKEKKKIKKKEYSASVALSSQLLRDEGEESKPSNVDTKSSVRSSKGGKKGRRKGLYEGNENFDIEAFMLGINLN